MVIKVILTPRELLYIAALQEAPEFVGIADAFYGMNEQEMRLEITALQMSLEDKGYAQMDFNGSFTLRNEVQDTVSVCATCDTFILVDKNKKKSPQMREFYYAKNGQVIRMDEKDGFIILTPISDTEKLLNLVMHDIEWQSEDYLLQNVQLSNNALTYASEQIAGSDLLKGYNILMGNGCDELSARTILEGLSGIANYYAVAITIFKEDNEGTNSVMLIDSPNGIYKLNPIILEDDTAAIQFDSLTIAQSEKAIADIIHIATLNQTVENEIRET